jgi:hypothetical protein
MGVIPASVFVRVLLKSWRISLSAFVRLSVLIKSEKKEFKVALDHHTERFIARKVIKGIKELLA